MQPTDWLIVYYSCGPYVQPADCSIVAAVSPMCSRLINWGLQLWAQCVADWLIDCCSCGHKGTVVQPADWMLYLRSLVQPADWLIITAAVPMCSELIDWLLQLRSHYSQLIDWLIDCYSCGPTCSHLIDWLFVSAAVPRAAAGPADVRLPRDSEGAGVHPSGSAEAHYPGDKTKSVIQIFI